MSDWFATPDAAVSAVGRKGRLAVFDLYQRAHQLGYGPMFVTDRELAEEWGCSRGEVWRWLEALQAARLALLERAPPGARRASVLTVFSPFSQTRSQNGSQNGAPPTPAAPVREPDAEPDAEPSRAVGPPAQRPHQTIVSPSVAGATGRALAVARLLALQEAEEPAHGLTGDRDRAAVERALARTDEDRLAALWAWSGVSDDPLVAGCRNGWRRWGSLLRAPQGEARIAAAWAWHEAGRQLPQPTRARRPEAAPARRWQPDSTEPLETYASAAELEADLRTWCTDEGVIAEQVRQWTEARGPPSVALPSPSPTLTDDGPSP